jgi:ComF family protein
LGGEVHPVCERKYGLDGLWSLGVYGGSLRRAIQKLKYKWISSVAEELTGITVEYWAKYPPVLLDKIKKTAGKNWIVTSVPLYPARQRWRGFNQSELLAKQFADKLGLDYGTLLKRIRNTTPQMKLSAPERRKNIKNAFESAKTFPSNSNILLIDDVWTTGSTLKECCYEMKKGGAKTVWALTIAR